jgi:excisionase family DNA binding protein
MEVAEQFRVTPRTIQRWARDRRVPHVRIGRRILFQEAQVEQILAAYQQSVIEPAPSSTVPNPFYRSAVVVVPMRRPTDAA